MWGIILNCIILAIVSAIGAFAEMFAEMMIASEHPRRQQQRNQNHY